MIKVGLTSRDVRSVTTDKVSQPIRNKSVLRYVYQFGYTILINTVKEPKGLGADKS